MVQAWVTEEMQTADLQDHRLEERLAVVLGQLASQPRASIRQACGGHAEMTAAYRLFDNPKASVEAILAPHRDATRRRIAKQPVALLVQDTTELDLTRPASQVLGTGPLDGGSRRGVFVHPLHAFTPDGTPLGTLQAITWSRPEPEGTAASRAELKKIAIEDKESNRWLEMLQHAGEETAFCPGTQLICVADSEADIYELLDQGQQQPGRVDWIVRAARNRALKTNDDESEKLLWDRLLAQPVLFTKEIQVRGRKAKIACDKRKRRQPRNSRKAVLEVRQAQVTLRAPYRPDRKLPAVTVNVILAREIDAPDGCEPVEWLILTSLPIETLAQVQQVLAYYCVRWMIEVFFRVLKSGCRIEERRFEDVDRLLTCLAVYLIVCWRTLYVCRLGRSCPEVSCEAIFEPAEWKAVWQVTQSKPPPVKPPRLGQMVRLVAQLGGYIDRKQPPGPQTLWIGLQRAYDFALCWKRFGPEARGRATFV